jgi:hypothetical protein
MDTKTLFGVLLVAGIVGGFSINSYFMNNETIEDNIIDVEVGNEAPNFTITDTEGNSFNLSDFENDKVLVLEFMNISLTQTENENKDKLEERAEDKNWTYAMGSEEMTDAFGADRSPSIVIIDKDGLITFSESGPMSKSELEEKINEALE